jgi:hypothetical protein
MSTSEIFKKLWINLLAVVQAWDRKFSKLQIVSLIKNLFILRSGKEMNIESLPTQYSEEG